MLDFSWSHILIVLIVALVVVGPKDLPRMMHMVGRWVGKARGMANEFKKSFDEMARQGELDELRREIENLRKASAAATEINIDLNPSADPVLPEVEPRAGEFKVTEEPVPVGAVPEPHVAPHSEPQPEPHQP